MFITSKNFDKSYRNSGLFDVYTESVVKAWIQSNIEILEKAELDSLSYDEELSVKKIRDEMMSLKKVKVVSQNQNPFAKGVQYDTFYVRPKMIGEGINESYELEKGKKASLGEVRTYSGRKYQKTAKGWEPYREGTKAPAKGDDDQGKNKVKLSDSEMSSMTKEDHERKANQLNMQVERLSRGKSIKETQDDKEISRLLAERDEHRKAAAESGKSKKDEGHYDKSKENAVKETPKTEKKESPKGGTVEVGDRFSSTGPHVKDDFEIESKSGQGYLIKFKGGGKTSMSVGDFKTLLKTGAIKKRVEEPKREGPEKGKESGYLHEKVKQWVGEYPDEHIDAVLEQLKERFDSKDMKVKHTGTSKEEFVDKVNDKVKELMRAFTNPKLPKGMLGSDAKDIVWGLVMHYSN